MVGIVIIGSQYGDEGKGKITDILAKQAHMVVRFQGGNNAGHTVVVGEQTFKFHLLPSGVVEGTKSMLASGMVLDPRVLKREIEDFAAAENEVDLLIDPLTHIILPYHNDLDGAHEKNLGQKKIGTTKKGIGPCYADKISRCGIRFFELLDKKTFALKLKENYRKKEKVLREIYGTRMSYSYEEILVEYTGLASYLAKYIGDVSKQVADALAEKRVLFEGAQGSFLDIGFGTYPFVTSSHTLAGGVFTNVGLPPQDLAVIGIVKAYTTRVGSGPFPTELTAETGARLREKGNEYGTTTGRPRRCGWLDLPMLRYANRLNGFSSLALTKLDVLSGLEKIRIGVEYRLNGKKITYPMTLEQLEKADVVYKEMPGFEIDRSIRSYAGLPENAKSYIAFIEVKLGVKIGFVSIGPKRSQTIVRQELWK